MSRLRDDPERDALRTMFVRQGFNSPVLERIGSLILGCSRLENELEIVIWQLGVWPEAGTRPETDRMMAAGRIAEFRRRAGKQADETWSGLRRQVDEFADAADNILAYRNAIAHGHPIGSLSGDAAPMSISNTRWNGELRNRDSQTAYLDEPVLDLVSSALYILLRAIHAGKWQAQEAMRLPALLQSPGLSKARSMSGEARHLAELMNHEKY